jgi:hypothetical protein
VLGIRCVTLHGRTNAISTIASFERGGIAIALNNTYRYICISIELLIPLDRLQLFLWPNSSETSTEMSSRGLPGFLRRSRRWNDFEDDDDDDDNDEVQENGKDNKDNMKQQQQQQQQQNQDHQPQEQQRNNEPSHLLNASLQFLVPSSLAVSSAKEDVNAGYTGINTATDSDRNGKHEDEVDARLDDAIHNNDNQSFSTLGDFDPTVGDTSPHNQLQNASPNISDASYHSSSKIGYREAQFEKILSNSVVKMSELRKIGWNGIPVGFLFFCLFIEVICVLP